MIISYGSLVMMSGLIASNINGFAQNFLRFSRHFFRSFLSGFVTADIMMLLTTEIIGVAKLMWLANLLDLFTQHFLPDAVQPARKVQKKYQKFADGSRLPKDLS